MLTRICLFIAIVAVLAAAVLNVVVVRDKITTLVAERNDWHGKYDTSQADLAKTRSDLDKTTKTLKSTQQELASTKTERDKAVEQAAAEVKKASELSDKLAKSNQERDDAQAYLARYKGTGFEPEQILTLGKQIKDAQAALEESKVVNVDLQRQLKKTQVELAKFIIPEYHVPLPVKLRGKVLVVDPKWDFVVLNVGEDQDVLKDGELLVSRDGRLVAKVRISSVQKDRSIANVLPGWKLGDVIEGDMVMPAYPGS